MNACNASYRGLGAGSRAGETRMPAGCMEAIR